MYELNVFSPYFSLYRTEELMFLLSCFNVCIKNQPNYTQKFGSVTGTEQAPSYLIYRPYRIINRPTHAICIKNLIGVQQQEWLTDKHKSVLHAPNSLDWKQDKNVALHYIKKIWSLSRLFSVFCLFTSWGLWRSAFLFLYLCTDLVISSIKRPLNTVVATMLVCVLSVVCACPSWTLRLGLHKTTATSGWKSGTDNQVRKTAKAPFSEILGNILLQFLPTVERFEKVVKHSPSLSLYHGGDSVYDLCCTRGWRWLQFWGAVMSSMFIT